MARNKSTKDNKNVDNMEEKQDLNPFNEVHQDGEPAQDSTTELEIKIPEVNNSEISNSEVNNSEVSNSEASNSEAKNSEANNSEVSNSKENDSVISNLEISNSKENDSEISNLEISKFEIDNSEEQDTKASSDEEVQTEDKKPEAADDTVVEPDAAKVKTKWNRYKIIRIICLVGFIIFSALFINEAIIQPWRTKQVVELSRDLFSKPTDTPYVSPIPTQAPSITQVPDEIETTTVVEATPTPDPNRDELGRLIYFKDLLAINEDVKGWITIPGTEIDYVVMQSETPDYYLDKDIHKEYSKAGTLYLDWRSSVERNTKNFVIYGHNMVSTPEGMFHEILQYKNKNLKYYKKNPVITFDSLYQTGKWKIISVFITNGSSKNEPLFEYRTSDFKNTSEYLNFVYQLRVRSLLNIDTVDFNENDQIITLSTCSYEVDRDYRTVVVARKVRDGEDPAVDVDSVTRNSSPLYPASYYKAKGGEAPELYKTFEEALENGAINWYKPVEDAQVQE